MKTSKNLGSPSKKRKEEPSNSGEKNDNKTNSILRTRNSRRYLGYSLLPIHWQVSRAVSCDDESSDYSA